MAKVPSDEEIEAAMKTMQETLAAVKKPFKQKYFIGKDGTRV